MIDTTFFADPLTLISGAITGFLFGFLLRKGHLTRANVIIRQFTFEDFTVLKVMFTGIVVGSVGVWTLYSFGAIDGLHLKSADLLGNIIGGGILGVGMVILGYCPGTAVAALGDGAKDAVFGILGMLLGAAVYAEAFPLIKSSLLTPLSYGKVTLPEITGISPWVFVGALVLMAVIGFSALERYERAKKN